MSDPLRLFPELAGYEQVGLDRLPDLTPTDAGRGLVAEGVDLDAILRSEQRLSGVPTGAGLDLSIERHLGRPSVFVLSGPSALRVLRGEETAVREVDGLVAVDLARLDQPVLLRAMEGPRRFVLQRVDAHLEVSAFVPPAAEVPAPTISSPVADWVQEDPWLGTLVAGRLGVLDPFEHVVAVGLAWRLGQREPGAERARLARLLAGEPETLDLRENSWARSLMPDASRWVETQALHRIPSLRDRLDRLVDDSAEVSSEVWRAEAGAVCRDRDALEGVALVLQAAGGGAHLEHALEVIDVAGRATLDAVPPFALDDEHLRRAAQVDPDGWWTKPARTA